jgi:hypothetical protein
MLPTGGEFFGGGGGGGGGGFASENGTKKKLQSSKNFKKLASSGELRLTCKKIAKPQGYP